MAKVLEPEVLIVGAGVAGSLLAQKLKAKNLDVMLVERLPKPRPVFKGEYLQPSVVEIFEQMGLADIFTAPSTCSIRELRFRDLDHGGNVASDLLMGYPAGRVARSISHLDLLSGLTKHNITYLGENFYPGAQLTNESLDDDTPEFTLMTVKQDKLKVKPRWVVGCDGRNSTVRKWMGVERAPTNSPVTLGTGHEFIMGCEIPKPALNPQRYEIVRSYAHGTLSAFSLHDHGQRLYFSHPEVENLVKTAGQQLRQVVKKIQPILNLGEIPNDAPVVGSPANTSWYAQPARGRFLLAGDAVSVTTPYGGQGMTALSEHVVHLSEYFDWRADGRGAISASEREYSKSVRQSYDRINLLNFGLYYLFFARRPFWKMPTHHIAQTWTDNPALSARVMRLFAGIDKDRPTARELMDLWGIGAVGKSPEILWRLRNLPFDLTKQILLRK